MILLSINRVSIRDFTTRNYKNYLYQQKTKQDMLIPSNQQTIIDFM